MGKPLTVHLHLNPRAEALQSFALALPDRFDAQGGPLHDGRNRIKAFETTCGKVAVKRYGTPNRIVYSFLRKGKARLCA